LITWYEGVIEQALDRLDATHLPDLVAIAKAPMEIRGYGPVKDEAIHKVMAHVDRMIADVRSSRTPTDSGGASRHAALGAR
jgi:indolepyruvate ferredoxin oxidoreductase